MGKDLEIGLAVPHTCGAQLLVVAHHFCQDRIHLKPTHYAYAQHLEAWMGIVVIPSFCGGSLKGLKGFQEHSKNTSKVPNEIKI